MVCGENAGVGRGGVGLGKGETVTFCESYNINTSRFISCSMKQGWGLGEIGEVHLLTHQHYKNSETGA